MQSYAALSVKQPQDFGLVGERVIAVPAGKTWRERRIFRPGGCSGFADEAAAAGVSAAFAPFTALLLFGFKNSAAFDILHQSAKSRYYIYHPRDRKPQERHQSAEQEYV